MTVIATHNAPTAIGPYAQARIHGNTLYVSGQLPILPATGEIVSDDVIEQTRQSLKNIMAIANAAGSDLQSCLKTTVLVTDLSKFAAINAAYAEFFQEPFPARATYEVSALPKGAQIEIEAIFSLSKSI